MRRGTFSHSIFCRTSARPTSGWACAMSTVKWTTGCNWSAARVSFRQSSQRLARSASLLTRDRNDVDAYNGHITTETRFSDSLWFTTAYSYSTLNSDISGTRIIGADYDSMYGDPILTLQSNDHGMLNLSGVSQVDEHVVNLNLMWMPVKELTVLTRVPLYPRGQGQRRYFSRHQYNRQYCSFHAHQSGGRFPPGSCSGSACGRYLGHVRQFRGNIGVALRRNRQLALLCAGRMGRRIRQRARTRGCRPDRSRLDEQGHRPVLAEIHRWRQLVSDGGAQHGRTVLS